MPEKTEFAPGTFCWADLATSDVEGAGRFYSQLFGWTVHPIDDPNAGGYTMLRIGDKDVAALAPKQDPNQPTAWTTYVAVEDADKTVEIAQSNGATVVMPPFDVFDAGRMAILVDPAGAVFALWQAGVMPGAAIVDEDNTLGWVETTTRDTAKAKAFYTAVFGWGAKENSMGDMTYTEFTQGDQSIAGMMATPPQVPAEVPSYWMPYFQVSDIDAKFAKATSLGAGTVVAVESMPQLKFAILTDPQGALFGLYQSTSA